jgi:cellulose synthase/poly-beta-1,6-N-acetylglucosamine synthase-like glycosyltransferase
VYVDSASTDDSCNSAREHGASVVELDMSVPFTAARARNAGFEKLVQEHPELEYVQFIDGDCEVVSEWLDVAIEELDRSPEVVAVCGWRKERHPESSVFNRICDVEWHSGPVGTTGSFGGDVMIRAAAFRELGGYNPKVIAAEDDELSVRFRKAGGRLLRVDRDSTIHDADIHRTSQWWRRATRCGYGYAQVSGLHGAPPERKFVPEKRRVVLWGFAVPVVALALAPVTAGLSCVAFARYPVSGLRAAMLSKDLGFPVSYAAAWGVSCALSPFPEFIGVAKYHWDRLRDRHPEVIEYKGVA